MLDPKVIVALDYPTREAALTLAGQLDPSLCRLKVGKEMFTLFGPALVEQLQGLGFDVFLDLKFHDIPNTTSRAVAAAAELGVWMVNVHASGGRRMMTACAEMLAKRSGTVPLLIAVTVLTSLEQGDLQEIGLDCEPLAQVDRLARLAQDCGLDGVVCSAQEAAELRRKLGNDFALVTPGIRPAFAAQDDQKRIMTPADALRAGSSYLVIGRPITQAQDPLEALRQIQAEIAAA